MIVCDSVDDMQYLYDAYAGGGALRIKWYKAEDPAFISQHRRPHGTLQLHRSLSDRPRSSDSRCILLRDSPGARPHAAQPYRGHDTAAERRRRRCTLAIYMGIATLPLLRDGLAAAGQDP